MERQAQIGAIRRAISGSVLSPRGAYDYQTHILFVGGHLLLPFRRDGMKRSIALYYFLTIVSIFLLSCIYEFWMEDEFGFFDASGTKETAAEHWEYVFTVTIFSAIALILPTFLVYRAELRRRKSEADKLRVQAQLDEALTKLLGGFVSICSVCKKVRVENEENKSESWNDIAEYITRRTDLTFSHGYCPDCLEKTRQGHHVDT